MIHRRDLLALSGASVATALLPAWAHSAAAPAPRALSGDEIKLTIGHVPITVDEETSIHWHGVLTPSHMDGVPGLSFPGIKPEFAPYVGVNYERRFGDTARFARAAGEDRGDTRLVIGLNTWF